MVTGNLHTQFGSGAMFTAGASGAITGVSGINDITQRINSVTGVDGEILAPLISGTSTQFYGKVAEGIYPGEGIDITNGSIISCEDATVTNKGIIELATEDEVQTGTDTTRAVVPDTLQVVMSPVGSIVAWLKTLAGVPQTLPVGWKECDGSAISDADSPMNGQNTPDLNGGEFLRGSSTTGGTGGTATSTATFSTSSSVSPGKGGAKVGWDDGSTRMTVVGSSAGTFRQADTTTPAFSIIPPYYNVVWIMRIK